MPLVIAARPALGTINHTLLTIEAARAAGLDPSGVVMTPWADDDLARSNRETVERIGGVSVSCLREVTLDELDETGARLPLDDWLPGG